MWDKLRLQDRDRVMALVFLAAFFACVGFCLLAFGLPQAALVTGIVFLIPFCVVVFRIVRVWLQIRSARAPVGPLSTDERLKARSKLIKPRNHFAHAQHTSSVYASSLSRNVNRQPPPAPTFVVW